MKGKLLLTLCLLLLLSSLSYARFSQTVTKASIDSPVHNLNTGLNYTTIQDAINANETIDGQTIHVDGGTYYEHVVVNKPLTLIGEDRDNTIVDGNGTGPAFLLNAQNVSLINFTAGNAGFQSRMPAAVLLNQTTNCLVENVETLNSSLYGICLYVSCRNQISGCVSLGNQTEPLRPWTTNQCGIFLANSNENAITNNFVSGNDYFGIGLGGPAGCNNNLLADNQVTFNGHGFDIVGLNNNVTSNDIWNNMNGLLLDMANYTVVSGNNISNNENYGVWLINGAGNNTFCGNTIQNNTIGICGTHSTQNSGNNNLFYHNNMIENSVQLIMPPDASSAWDNGYPAGGNYWSDYNGKDALSGMYQNVSGSDGIGDTPYSIDMYNVTDRYPLMGMFSDFSVTAQCTVQTVCNSTISDFQFNGTSVIFDASGENGTTGLCRICIPMTLINGTLTVFVNRTEIPYTLLPESNSTVSYLYFTYRHSTQGVIITPEFPSFLILPLFLIATMLTAMIYKKIETRTT